MSEERPKWTHQTPEELARWLVGHRITKITHHWEMTGVDTSREWIVLHAENSEKRFPSRFFRENTEFEFAPDHVGLVQERPYAGVRKSIDNIDAWEKANARDRTEFERLKSKFGNT